MAERLTLGLPQPLLSVRRPAQAALPLPGRTPEQRTQDLERQVQDLTTALHALLQYLDSQQRFVESFASLVLESIANRHMVGLAADRPSAGEEGRTYFATDTNVFSIDIGTAWKQFQASGSLTWDTA